MSRRDRGLPPPSADVTVADAAGHLRAALAALEIGYTEQPGVPQAVQVAMYAGTLAGVCDVILSGFGPEGRAIAAEARALTSGRMRGGDGR